MTATILFLMCWVTLLLAGTTPIGRLFRRMLVELPAAALNRLKPAHVALAIVVMMLVVVHFSAGENDPTRMIALFAPDIALWLASIEISMIVEAAVALAAAAGMLRRAGIAAVLAVFSYCWPGRRGHRPYRTRMAARRDRRLPANDDEDGPVALAG